MKVRDLQRYLKKVDPNLDVVIITVGPIVRELEWKIGWQRPVVRNDKSAIIIAEPDRVEAYSGPAVHEDDHEDKRHLYIFA